MILWHKPVTSLSWSRGTSSPPLRVDPMVQVCHLFKLILTSYFQRMRKFIFGHKAREYEKNYLWTQRHRIQNPISLHRGLWTTKIYFSPTKIRSLTRLISKGDLTLENDHQYPQVKRLDRLRSLEYISHQYKLEALLSRHLQIMLKN